MKRILLCCALLVITAAGVASAQVSIRVVDTLYVRTESSQDAPARLRFGIDPEYTDTIDFKGAEFEIPGPPPAFYAAFIYLPPNQATSRPYINADYRGVPDSIRTGSARRSETRYLFEVFSNFATGQKVLIEFPRALASNIDSARITDAITDGIVLSHTFGRSGGSYTVENDGVNRFYLTVYTNLDISRVIADDRRPNEIVDLGISPNPVRGSERIALRNAVPAGARVLLTDMRGQEIELVRTVEETSGLQIELPRLLSGVYMVRLIGADGTLLRSGRLVRVD